MTDPAKLLAFLKVNQEDNTRQREPFSILVPYLSLNIGPGRVAVWGNPCRKTGEERWSPYVSKLQCSNHHDQDFCELGDPEVISSFRLCGRKFFLMNPKNTVLLTLVPFYFTPSNREALS